MKNKAFPVGIDDISIKEAINFCASASGSYRFVVTPNVDHMCRIYKSPAYLSLHEGADLVLCDSKILQYLSYMKREKINHVVRGSDLVEELLHCLESNKSILVVGDSQDSAQLLKSKFGLVDVSVIVPSMGFESKPDEINAIVEAIAEKAPDLILLAVGSPRQEILANMLANFLDRGVAICCGNAVNFAIGKVRRSPRWMSAIGLEWLHRLSVEPRRLAGRYFSNLAIFWYFFILDFFRKTR